MVNQYYWYRMRAEIGASNMHSQITYFAPHDPGYVLDVSPAGVLKSSTHQAAAQKFLAFIVSKQGQEIIAHSISFEYPIASGVTTAQPETPFDQLQPNSDHHLRARRRLDGHRPAERGRAAVSRRPAPTGPSGARPVR